MKENIIIKVENNSAEVRQLKKAIQESPMSVAYYKFKRRYFNPLNQKKQIDIKSLSDLYTKVNQLSECIKVFIKNLEDNVTDNQPEYNTRRFKNTAFVNKHIRRQIFRLNAIKNPNEKQSEADKVILSLYRLKNKVEKDITEFGMLLNEVK